MNIKDMIGKTFTSVKGEIGGEDLIFENDSETFMFYHSQDCCESVEINDITGDLQDLIGDPLLIADEVIGESQDFGQYDSCTWTFYKFATRKGYVDVRWLGESNGYYSENVDLKYIPKSANA